MSDEMPSDDWPVGEESDAADGSPPEESTQILGDSDGPVVKSTTRSTIVESSTSNFQDPGDADVGQLGPISKGPPPPPAVSLEDLEPARQAPEAGKVVDLQEARDRVSAKIAALTQDYDTPVRAGISMNRVDLGFQAPDHFDGEALLQAALKPINWQVENLWTERAKIVLASEPKAGKTYFVCEFAMALATGKMLWDALKVPNPAPVGIIAAEDDEGEIGRRLHRMCRAKGLLLGNLPIHWWPGDRIRLNRSRDIDWIRRQIKEYGIKLMIYDPMARLMDGDENSKEQVAGVLNPASTITREDDCSVMIVHHLGKDNPDQPKTLGQRLRGSSDIRSWYTTAVFLTGKLGNGRVGVEIEQRTSGKIPGEFTVKAQEVEEQSVYGLGSLKLVADVRDRSKTGGEANNQQLIDNAAEKILAYAMNKGAYGITTSEIGVNLNLGKTIMNAALKKLIREDNVLAFEEAKNIPDGKVLVALENVLQDRARRAARNMPKMPPAPLPEAEPDVPQGGLFADMLAPVSDTTAAIRQAAEDVAAFLAENDRAKAEEARQAEADRKASAPDDDIEDAFGGDPTDNLSPVDEFS